MRLDAILPGVIENMIDMSDPYVSVHACSDWRERLKALKRNYAIFQKLVDAGKEDWLRGCPYQIAEWMRIFTPIENDMWGELRSAGLPSFWPQLPVGRYFVDFGNPVLKIAIECDGQEFHNPADDFIRDSELATMGWQTFRASGALCRNTMEHPDDRRERTGEDDWRYEAQFKEETLSGLIDEVRERVGYLRQEYRR